MKTSLNHLGVATLTRLGRNLGVKQFNINPTDINQLNLDMDMSVENIDPEYIPVVYVWDWYKGVIKIQKNGDTLGGTIELAELSRFSHIAIHFPACMLLQVHRVTEVDLGIWRVERDWELSGGDKNLTALSSSSHTG